MAQLVDVTMPSQQEGTESVVAQWLKKPGDAVKAHEPLLEINTDKAVVEVAAPATGILQEVLKKEGDPVEPQDVLARIQPDGAAVEAKAPRSSGAEAAETAPKTAPKPSSAEDSAELRLSPAVRRILKEHQLDASQIGGTGRGGRITHQDVVRYVEAQAASPAPAKPAAFAGDSRRVPHSPMRKRIAAHMVESALRTAPHVTSVFEADFSALIRHRRSAAAEFEKQGVRLTYTAYLAAAAAKALSQVPEINSRWRDDAMEIFRDCNIGVAVAVGREGLLVPVIRKAQQLSLFGLASQLQELTEKARKGKLSPEEMEGGTFTITNHGVSGSLIATPIINQPQSAILGVGKVQKRLVVTGEDGAESLQIKPMAYVTLTVDHRGLDGFTANLFLSKFVAELQGWPG